MGIVYQSSGDPKRVAQNQRDYLTQRGDDLTSQAQQQQRDEDARRQQTADYLSGIYQPMAEGQGGYSADEASAIAGDPYAGARTVDQYASKIEMSPQEKQDIVTGAGITVGNRNQAAVDSLERSGRAAGMSPMGVAAYRQRMEHQAAGDAADAMTQARVNAGNASANRAATVMNAKVGAQNYGDTSASNRAQTVANTRLGQQTQGLQYYQGQNEQANQNSQNAANRAANLYGTQAGATNTATQNQINASQIPSTWQKVAGGIGGALTAASAALEDGAVVTSPTVALVGENGPEAVVPLSNRPQPNVTPGVMGYGMPRPVAPKPQPQRRYYGQTAA